MSAETDQMTRGPGHDSLLQTQPGGPRAQAAGAQAQADGARAQADGARAQADGLPAPRVLRMDHVQLTGAVPGLPFLSNGKVRKGWLVLTDGGEFRFYDKPPRDMTTVPALSAATAEQFVKKIGVFGVRVRFGKAIYNMWFTGEPSPERPAADIEEKAGQAGDIASNLGTIVADAGVSQGQAISAGGDVVSLAVTSLQLFRVAQNRKRRAAARGAWYPVLRGARPWAMINAAGEAAPELPGPGTAGGTGDAAKQRSGGIELDRQARR